MLLTSKTDTQVTRHLYTLPTIKPPNRVCVVPCGTICVSTVTKLPPRFACRFISVCFIKPLVLSVKFTIALDKNVPSLFKSPVLEKLLIVGVLTDLKFGNVVSGVGSTTTASFAGSKS